MSLRRRQPVWRLRLARATLASMGMLGMAIEAAAQGPAAGAASAPSASAYTERYGNLCAACHGASGVSALAGVPSLAGQPSFYAVTQLFLFRDGRRDNAAMTAIAKDMSDADLRGYSDAIGRLPPAPTAAVAPPDPARQASGAVIAKRLHCLGCHGDAADGGRQVPRLAGQREDYLQLALRGFRTGSRVGYTAAMNETLAGVAAAEIDDLAHYFAHFATPATVKALPTRP